MSTFESSCLFPEDQQYVDAIERLRESGVLVDNINERTLLIQVVHGVALRTEDDGATFQLGKDIHFKYMNQAIELAILEYLLVLRKKATSLLQRARIEYELSVAPGLSDFNNADLDVGLADVADEVARAVVQNQISSDLTQKKVSEIKDTTTYEIELLRLLHTLLPDDLELDEQHASRINTKRRLFREKIRLLEKRHNVQIKKRPKYIRPVYDHADRVTTLRDTEVVDLHLASRTLIPLQPWGELRPRLLEALGTDSLPHSISLVCSREHSEKNTIEDQKYVYRHIRDEIGEDNMETCTVRFLMPYVFKPNSLLLILSNAAVAHEFAWYLENDINGNGCLASGQRVLCLVSDPMDTWPRGLSDSCVNPIEWEGSSLGSSRYNDGRRLAALTSPLLRIEPDLLRAIRKSCMPHSNVGAEKNAMKLYSSLHSAGFSHEPSALEHLRELWMAESADAKRMITSLLHTWGKDYSPILHLEQLILYGLDQNIIEIDVVVKAKSELLRDIQSGLDGQPYISDFYIKVKPFLKESLSLFPEVQAKIDEIIEMGMTE